MSSRRLRRSLSVAVASTATLASTLMTVPAHAVTPIVDGPLDITSVSAFVADNAHGHLLFGSAQTSNGVLVTDLSGDTVATLVGTAPIDDISVSSDGHYAFAASKAIDKIYQLDLTNLTVTHTFSLPVNQCPTSVAAVSSTYVAFGYACGSGSGGVGVLTLATGTTYATANTMDYYPEVRLVPGTTKVISAGRQITEAVVAEYQTASAAAPTLLHDTSNQSYGLGDCEGLNEFSVSPDGATMLTACGSPYTHKEYEVADFTPAADYSTNAYPTATAFSPDGSYVATGMDGTYDNDVAVFHHGDGSLVYSLDYTDSQTAGPTTPADGLAFSADGTQLYALAIDRTVTPSDLYLVTLPVSSAPTFPPVDPPPVTAPPVTAPPVTAPPAPAPVARPVASAITAVSPPRQFVGHPFALTGTLNFAGLPAAGVPLTITKTVANVTTTLGTTTTTTTGTFSYAITPNLIGAVTYAVGYLGDLKHYGSSTTAITVGTRAPAQLALGVTKVKGKVYAVTAHLSSWGANRHVLITANKKVIGNAVVNSKGMLTVHFTRKKATTFVAVFTGDANDYPARATKGLH